jgi:hypothetical protein
LDKKINDSLVLIAAYIVKSIIAIIKIKIPWVSKNACCNYFAIDSEYQNHVVVHVIMIKTNFFLVDFKPFFHDANIHNKVCIFKIIHNNVCKSVNLHKIYTDEKEG